MASWSKDNSIQAETISNQGANLSLQFDEENIVLRLLGNLHRAVNLANFSAGHAN